MTFEHYDTGGFFDEMFGPDGCPRPVADALVRVIDALPDGELRRRQRSAERALLNMGITFNVYGDHAGTERIFPFDLVPRMVSAVEWGGIERGLTQRIQAAGREHAPHLLHHPAEVIAILREMQHGAAHHGLHAPRVLRQMVETANREVVRRQRRRMERRQLPDARDGRCLSIDAVAFETVPQEVHEVAAVAAPCVEHPAAPIKASARDLVEQVDVDLAEHLPQLRARHRTRHRRSAFSSWICPAW